MVNGANKVLRKLTNKQQLFGAKFQTLHNKKMDVLRDIARHVGLLGKVSQTPAAQQAIKDFFPDIEGRIKKAIETISDKHALPVRRTVNILLLDCICPGWKKNISQDILGWAVGRGDSEVAQWRREVLIRDNHACVNCGATKTLEVHHVTRWIDAPHLRVTIDNGITLCNNCHKKEHAKEI